MSYTFRILTTELLQLHLKASSVSCITIQDILHIGENNRQAQKSWLAMLDEFVTFMTWTKAKDFSVDISTYFRLHSAAIAKTGLNEPQIGIGVNVFLSKVHNQASDLVELASDALSMI